MVCIATPTYIVLLKYAELRVIISNRRRFVTPNVV